MQVMLLAYEAPEDFACRADKAKYEAYMRDWYAFSEEISKSGACKESKALETPETASVLTVKDGRRHVEDGPFPDSKEQLGGFFLLDVASLDEAAEWAAKCPAAKNGYVDVRVIPDFGQEG